VRLAIRRKIRQVHVVIAERQERLAQRIEHAWFVTAKVVRENEVQRRSSFGLIFIVPVGAVPGATVLNLFHGEAEQKQVFFP